MVEHKQKNEKQIIVGRVTSNKMDKTIVVETSRTVRHPRFHKILKKVKKYHVHDEDNVAHEGDTVEIYEGRPKSKLKHMYLFRVVESDSL
jgi:small subunit ribosomal protein S17